ncbi:selenocysteine-specific translation elongation factor [Pusillimonas sp. TS35]|uniref:selenocysteine-specific translation elongation factor n=1 Tax=Paracandidimonas lactea TaxID=2895524 RepID=UPI0013703263|nr:selenocysteine-specific translation elongation factor [Paracandidimonas lactea]MYN13047.1 selenocysteine-specific translation elongation factor [Pusillimonas sp. TS35]
MIVGTAGHIDHGKTTLVRALTGVDTDRLKEEKARGISIELGYAYLPLPNGDTLGFIDVPGHERLVHTMAAGATGIDFGLLVVAADDGVMPQTQEHLAILQLLAVQRGAVALTKADRVDAGTLASVRTHLAGLTRGTFLEGAPVFPTDAASPYMPGVGALRDHLFSAAALATVRHDDGPFRLAIDRAFTLKGHGTIVTGTVHTGRIRVDDAAADLRLFPSGRPVRVRSLHTQNQSATTGRAGQRCALNLVGIDKDDIARGDWIAHSDTFVPGRNIDVHLTLLPGDDPALRAWAPVHVHLGAAHYPAHAVPLGPDALAAGESGWVQLVFDAPVCALPGDRFIVRSTRANRTIGGGMVLDPNAPDRKRRAPQRLAWLAAVAAMKGDGDLAQLLEHAPQGLDARSLMRLTGRPASSIAAPPNARWIPLQGAGGRLLVLDAHWEALAAHTIGVLQAFHARHPDEPGLDTGRLRRMAWPALPEAHWQALRDDLIQTGRMRRSGAWLHHPAHAATLSADEDALAQRLLPRALAGAYDPPWVRDHAQALDAPEELVRMVLRKLVRRGELFQITHDLFYHRDHIEALTAMVAQHGSQGINAAAFRDAAGIGRKRAVQILEFFDRAGYTRRLRDQHVPRSDSAAFWQRLS